MKYNYFNKSVSPKRNQKELTGKNKTNKKLLSFIQNNFVYNDNLNSNYKKQINYRFYYKNPQFLNNSSIQNQIDILLTNVNDNKQTINENTLSKSLKKFPEIKTLNNSVDIKSRKESFDSLISKDNTHNKENHLVKKNYDNIYKNIFPNSQLFKQKIKLIDNKLNIVYSQNELQYNRIIDKRNKLKKNENVSKLEKDSEKIKGQLEDIKTKIKFMKNVMDYSYPSFMLTKLKKWGKDLAGQKKMKNKEILTPFEMEKKLIEKKNIIRKNYLYKNINISPLKTEFYTKS